jgi:hypothetical protein
LAYILMASSQTIGPYAAGMVFYNIGQSGTNVMTVRIESIQLCRVEILLTAYRSECFDFGYHHPTLERFCSWNSLLSFPHYTLGFCAHCRPGR